MEIFLKQGVYLYVLLGNVSPDYAIISAKLNNSYGHPHQEVLALLQKFKIPSIATYESGTIVFKSDGENFVYVK
ncbi:MAG: hypothetical protein AAB488_00470 [Patescibacteria group bacterium]